MPATLLLRRPPLPLEVYLHPFSGFRHNLEPVLSQVAFSASVMAIPIFAPGPQYSLNLNDLSLPKELSRQTWFPHAHACRIDRAFHRLDGCANKVLAHARTCKDGQTLNGTNGSLHAVCRWRLFLGIAIRMVIPFAVLQRC